MSDDTADQFDFASDPYNQLVALLESDRVGVIDGIHFDLRHQSIPPDLWHAPDGAFGVDFLFPSERGDPADIDDDGLGRDGASFGEADWHQTLKEELVPPKVQAEVGDTISISRIRQFDRAEGPLADLHDAEERWAHLCLTRPSGQRIELEGTMQFVPRDALGPHSPHWPPFDDGMAAYVQHHGVTFEKIRRRIERLAKAGERRVPVKRATIDGTRYRITDAVIPMLPANAKIESGWATEGLGGDAADWLFLAEQAAALAQGEIDTVGDLPAPDLSVLLDTAAAAGYALARLESELRLTPLALNSLKVIEGGRFGGKKRAANRRAWIAEKWEPEALVLATKVRKGAPDRAQKDLASDIQNAWRLEGEQPGFEWLLAFIRAAEKRGDLHRRLRASEVRGRGREGGRAD